MFMTDVTGGDSISMLEKTLAFTEAQNRMLATNIANIMTPGYKTKQLDSKAFQSALRAATQRRQDGGEFKLDSSEQLEQGEDGLLRVHPTEEPAENVLFHDGTNARIERQMALLAENTMMHQAASDLLRHQFAGLTEAIRGRVA